MATTITLTIDGRNATGDDTVIVSHNKDYEVKVQAKNCASFTASSEQYLIVRHDRDYYECRLGSPTGGTYTEYKVQLPPLKYTDYVELGVCGKNASKEIEYCSKSARYKCEESIMSGVVALKNTFSLATKEIKDNGIFKATDDGVEGYSEVQVRVADKDVETRSLALAMSNGGMIIKPSNSNLLMSEVTIAKPEDLKPSNIKKGAIIGGVVGTYEATPKLIGAQFKSNGTFLPDSGYVGFSSVTVAVPAEARPTEPLIITSANLHQYQGKYTDVSPYGSVYINLDTFSV